VTESIETHDCTFPFFLVEKLEEDPYNGNVCDDIYLLEGAKVYDGNPRLSVMTVVRSLPLDSNMMQFDLDLIEE